MGRGEIGVVFETTPPFRTPWEMDELARWTNRALEEGVMHSLLAVAAFDRHGKGKATWYTLSRGAPSEVTAPE